MKDISREDVNDFFVDYAWFLDQQRYEEWLTLFEEKSNYRVIPRENQEAGLPACLIFCKGKDMLRDRITALLDVNQYNIHTTRHIIGRSRISSSATDGLVAETPYAVIQTDQDGNSRLFSVGAYTTLLSVVAGKLCMLDQRVVVDNFSVPTLLAHPL